MAFDLDLDKLTAGHVIPSLLGSIVSLRGAPGKTWAERSFNVFCGFLVALYLTPVASEYFGLQTEATRNGAAFFIGLFGMNLVAAIVVLVRDAKLSDVVPWFGKRG